MKLIDKDAVVAEIESLLDKGKYHDEYDCAYRDGNNGALYALKDKLDTLEVKEVDLDKEPIILTEEILKKNEFKLYAPPRYQKTFWSKIYEDKEKNMYVFDIYMEQRVEHLLTVTPLATPDGKGHPDCHLPHPRTVQQLQDSLRLFGIEDNIRVW